MNKKQLFVLGAASALTAFAPQLNAADAEVKAEVKRQPKAEVQAELDTNRREYALEADRDKITRINKASGILGMEVRNKQNEKLGEIKDLVMDIKSGRVSYAVLAVGGFLGVGEKLIALPPGALQATHDPGYLILDADKARIQAAPGFAATAWPSQHDPEINRFWREIGSTGSPATGETSRDRSKVDIDVDRKNDGKRIYTDADKDKKVKVEINKD